MFENPHPCKNRKDGAPITVGPLDPTFPSVETEILILSKKGIDFQLYLSAALAREAFHDGQRTNVPAKDSPKH